MDKEHRRNASKDAYRANKEEINKRRRELYAAKKDEINKRRRAHYAASTQLLQHINSPLSTNVRDQGTPSSLTCSIAPVIECVRKSPHSAPACCTNTTQLQGQTVGCQPTKPAQRKTSTCLNIMNNRPSTSSNFDANPHGVGVFPHTAFHETIRHLDVRERDPRTLVLKKVPACKYCSAFKFYRETDAFCCSGGDIHLAGSVLPQPLVDLITGTDAISTDFQNMIRTYNNHFAFTSIGMTCDKNYEHRNQGIYTVKVHGQVYHYLDDLLPHDASKNLRGLQFYFYDSEHQAMNRLAMLPRLDSSVVVMLVKLMDQKSPYVGFLKRASEIENLENYHIVIRSDPTLDQTVYNKPTSTEVAAIWIEDESGESKQPCLRDTRIYTTSGTSHNVQCYYGCYDPLQYVLMFPNGESGWHGNILRTGSRRKRNMRNLNPADCITFEDFLQSQEASTSLPTFDELQPDNGNILITSISRRRQSISCREYYAYKFQIRANDRSYLLRFGRLFQQYVVDNYIKIESMRLTFLKTKQQQDHLRMEYYQGIVDSVISGLQVGRSIGQKFHLPASFIGGPRDMRHRYLDSMALVQEYGKPDIFVTMTCNPNWPEIKEMLAPGEEAHNRPDLLARVFKAKLTILHDKIMSGEAFGQIASVVHVIEFQKRGLPHAHVLIILHPSYKYQTPEAYDRIVCAELPDQSEDPHFYSLVVKHMMHGPCSDLNPSNVCMKDGKCKNHYPKDFSDYTSHGKGNYPIYRRRNDGRTAKVRRCLLDNRWVIPYNPTLLLQFNCHMNVEVCCDIRAVKYLYKYIHKGHDKVMFRVASDISHSDTDEIADFQNARWVSPVEACWRIYGFPLFGMYPSVIQLQVHLPNFQTLRFDEDDDLQKVLENERQKRTMLLEFFKLNLLDPKAQKLNLLYKDFPRHYVWDGQSRTWAPRKKGILIGRLCVVTPIENERYYLRLLLNHVRGPTSYENLLTVGGVLYETFRESAHHRGLLHNDDDIEKTLQEAAVYKMPGELRRLFATLLHYCRPSNPKSLFTKFFEQMAEDFVRLQQHLQLSEKDLQCKVLQGINDTLESLGKDVNDYHLVAFRYIPTEFERYTREITAEKSIPIPEEDLHDVHHLNTEQKKAFDLMYHCAMSNVGEVFFIDGPGGTGKSFLYRVLLAHIRSKGYIALVVASSGIASSGFLGGRTAHSRFKIPIDIEPEMQCQISFQSSEADLIRESKIIIWDEAPMADKCVILALDKLLRFLCENTSPFGNKLVVFGGDFRQVLPVVKGGGRREQINASIVSSEIWQHFKRIKLTENMRAKNDPSFVQYLMRIGNGEEPVNEKGQIKIPQHMLIPYTTLESSIEALISAVYPDLSLFEKEPYDMMQRTILSPKNEFVDDINAKLIERLPGCNVIYISDDRAKNFADQGDYIDYLNTLEPKGLPQHKLVLKINSPVVLLRNINPVEGLCNGTRLICKQLAPNLVGAVIATGQHKGKHVWIPRIPLQTKPSDNKYSIPFVRRQIPLRLCFAMTINKSQGQTLDYVGIYLRHPAFTHGQLYVALSRAKTGKNVKVLIVPPTCNDPETNYTANVVYNEILLKASTS